MRVCVLLLLVLLPQCASLNRSEPERGRSPLRRAAKDLVVVATSPATLLTKPFQETGYTFDDGEALYAIASPLTFTFAVVRNAYWTAVHAVDLAIYPFYAFSRATPLAVYDLGTFPYQYLTAESRHGQRVHPPETGLLPLHVLTLGATYYLDPYAWKFSRSWPAFWNGTD